MAHRARLACWRFPSAGARRSKRRITALVLGAGGSAAAGGSRSAHRRDQPPRAARHLQRGPGSPARCCCSSISTASSRSTTCTATPAGDDCLRMFADALKESFRPDDHVVRYGGDEFLVDRPRARHRRRARARRRRDRAHEARLRGRIWCGFSVGMTELGAGRLAGSRRCRSPIRTCTRRRTANAADRTTIAPDSMIVNCVAYDRGQKLSDIPLTEVRSHLARPRLLRLGRAEGSGARRARDAAGRVRRFTSWPSKTRRRATSGRRSRSTARRCSS